MARLRLAGLLLALLTFGAAAFVKMIGAALPATFLLALAALPLVAVAPFLANDRHRRRRVYHATVAHVAASALGAVLAAASSPSPAALGAAAIPAAGAVLALWAYRTRNRQRSSMMARYYTS